MPLRVFENDGFTLCENKECKFHGRDDLFIKAQDFSLRKVGTRNYSFKTTINVCPKCGEIFMKRVCMSAKFFQENGYDFKL